MLKKYTDKLSAEYKAYKIEEKWFVFFIMICGFAISAEAAITRSVATSFFIDAYGSNQFPYAWLASLPLNFAIVAFYNKFIPRLGCGKMMGAVLSFTVAFNLFCMFFLKSIYSLPFFLYLWKDIFIIFMFHNLWSVIHSTIPIKRAKYIYGIFYGMGGLGSVLGNVIPGFLAVLLGSAKLLIITIPLYLITYLCYSSAVLIRNKISTSEDISMKDEKGSVFFGLKMIAESKILKFILLIVVGMQLTSTLLDFQFCTFLHSKFIHLDLRTQFMGRLFGVVNFINIFLQFFGCAILLKILGLRKTHLLIPSILLIQVGLFLVHPTFALICMAFGTIKSFDYSIFGIVKEMLYIPLNVSQKFQAKAIIDVFAYRSSKALGSFLILTLTYFSPKNITSLITASVICIFLLWMGAVISMRVYFANLDAENPLKN